MTSRDSFEYSPREEDLHLLPSRLFGYSLQDRRFVAFDVKNLRRTEEDRDMFSILIINRNHEAILRALVESHFIRKEINETRGIATISQDIVQNKGRGLVILLQGVPGVGKPSTAETIASNFQKPLLLTTCVFLRVLDYYSGILFLTTNRVGTIDEAFEFRIYICLYSPYLDLDQTEKIWEVSLDRLAAIEEEHGGGRKPLSIDREGILAFAEKHFTKRENGKGRWNGRQIRNAFLIASALAQNERTRGIKNGGNPCDLNGRHLKTVVKAGTGFEKYLLETRGMTDQEAAYLNSTRADDLQSQKAVNASRAAAPASAQPAKPLAYPGWVNQYPSQPSFVPPQAQAAYKLATSPAPANRLYPQQLQQPHYVFPGPSLQNTYEKPLIAEGYYQPQALTPVPQVQPHEHASYPELDM
ncbi:hypothetical protein NYO67_4749 [Aspergillus flavus]|nr:hypothetical protein NYO67_4749 [Aspergillus flavus]